MQKSKRIAQLVASIIGLIACGLIACMIAIITFFVMSASQYAGYNNSQNQVQNATATISDFVVGYDVADYEGYKIGKIVGTTGNLIFLENSDGYTKIIKLTGNPEITSSSSRELIMFIGYKSENEYTLYNMSDFSSYQVYCNPVYYDVINYMKDTLYVECDISGYDGEFYFSPSPSTVTEINEINGFNIITIRSGPLVPVSTGGSGSTPEAPDISGESGFSVKSEAIITSFLMFVIFLLPNIIMCCCMLKNPNKKKKGTTYLGFNVTALILSIVVVPFLIVVILGIPAEMTLTLVMGIISVILMLTSAVMFIVALSVGNEGKQKFVVDTEGIKRENQTDKNMITLIRLYNEGMLTYDELKSLILCQVRR